METKQSFAGPWKKSKKFAEYLPVILYTQVLKEISVGLSSSKRRNVYDLVAAILRRLGDNLIDRISFSIMIPGVIEFVCQKMVVLCFGVLKTIVVLLDEVDTHKVIILWKL